MCQKVSLENYKIVNSHGEVVQFLMINLYFFKINNRKKIPYPKIEVMWSTSS